MGLQTSELHGAPKILIAIGGLITILGLSLTLGGFDWILRTGIKSRMKIENGTDVWTQWKDVPIPAYLRVTVFNITNPDDVSQGAKAKLVEMGPYVYKERLYKREITINEEKGTVRYHQYREYTFQPEMSGGKENDKVTIPNIPYIAVAKMAHAFTDVDFVLTKLDEMLSSKGEKFTRSETVRDLLFDGFTIQPYIDLINDPMVQSAGEVKLPPQLENGRMGIYEGKNNSNDGWIETNQGLSDWIDFGRMVSFNGNSSVSAWKGAPCNMINGTDGMLFPPFPDPKSSVINIFAPGACRTLNFEAEELMSNYKGIPAVRYRQSEKMYMSVQRNPDNWCFCTPNVTCEINGFIDLGPCFGGAPIYLSQPHFLWVDQEWKEKVEGLNPDPEKHWGFMDLHHLLGLPIQSHHKMQFNLKVTQYYAMPTFYNLTDHFLPLMWIDEGAELTGKNFALLLGVAYFLKGWFFGRFVLIALGALVFPGLAIAIVMSRRGSNAVKRLDSAISGEGGTKE